MLEAAWGGDTWALGSWVSVLAFIATFLNWGPFLPPPTPGHLAMSGNSLVDALGRGVLPASNG